MWVMAEPHVLSIPKLCQCRLGGHPPIGMVDTPSGGTGLLCIVATCSINFLYSWSVKCDDWTELDVSEMWWARGTFGLKLGCTYRPSHSSQNSCKKKTLSVFSHAPVVIHGVSCRFSLQPVKQPKVAPCSFWKRSSETESHRSKASNELALFSAVYWDLNHFPAGYQDEVVWNGLIMTKMIQMVGSSCFFLCSSSYLRS